MKLLIVDDSAMIRKAIESAYQGSVFKSIENASDGAMAVSVFKEYLPDVVTLDITMPHMDGLAAMSQILDVNPNVSILIVSALADHHTAIEALSRGAHQFICKPFSQDDLKEALDDLLEERILEPVKVKTDSQETLKNTVAHRLKVSSDRSKKPLPEHYPSGFVAPVGISSLSNFDRPKKSTASVERQVSIEQIRRELQNENN